MRKIVFCSDLHVPFHNVTAYNLLKSVMASMKPDIIVVVGDLIDNYAISLHDKTHMRKMDFQNEINQARAVLVELSDLADECRFVAGNHEDRFPRYLARHCPADNRSANTIQDLLQLKKRWKYTPYKHHDKIGKLYITHDTGQCGKYAAHYAANDFQSNVVIGHTHRMGIVYSGDARGNPHVAASFGWLGNIEHVDYMHRIKANRDWQLGFGVGFMEERTGTVHLQAVPIVNGCCVVDGKLHTEKKSA